MNHPVYGLTLNPDQTARVTEDLVNRGFLEKDISILEPSGLSVNPVKKSVIATPREIYIGGLGGFGLLGGMEGSAYDSVALSGFESALILSSPYHGSLISSPYRGSLQCLGMVPMKIASKVLQRMGLGKKNARRFSRAMKYGKSLVLVKTENEEEISEAQRILEMDGAIWVHA